MISNRLLGFSLALLVVIPIALFQSCKPKDIGTDAELLASQTNPDGSLNFGVRKQAVFKELQFVQPTHIGQIPLVAILPNDTELINGPAQGRRRFLDMLISQYSPAFLSHLIQYERILSQRNALLRLFGEQQRFDKD